ncbi:MAG: RagB/SusD family nutrient uptake outer membrane protein [Tannerellaceae bacterium]|nr:RagB/SusD family nutrient uptake outer membrane protein [Tannerellaceae bacterium]
MKNIYSILTMTLLIVATSCLNNDFLDRQPLDKQTTETVFTTYDNFRTYAWKFYTYLPPFSGPTTLSKGPSNPYLFDSYSDNGFWGSPNSENPWIWQTVTVPATTDNWNTPYTRIREINLLLDHIKEGDLDEAEQRHWRSVGYFFKANEYYRLIAFFGSAIWVEHTLTENDTDVLFGERMPRLELAQKVLDMLMYAKENIQTEGDGENTINRHVVCALISRFGLFEGTWQKYHNLSDGKNYLQASYDASVELAQAFPVLHNHYDELFYSEELKGVHGIILYQNFLTDGKGHDMSRYVRTSSHYGEISAEGVAAYLCQDGKPIYTSDLFEGDKTTGDADVYTEFRHRDHRLYYNVCPPYKINTPGATATDPALIEYTDDPRDIEYIELMNKISGTANSTKTLPMLQWSGQIVREMPHFRENRYNMGQGFMCSYGGYYVWKYYNSHTPAHSANQVNSTDAVIFRMGEVLVNYAEAAWELGLFDQGVADATINKLRERAHVAPMKINAITADFDPKRDQTVDPVLWEIRRERRVELMFEGFRYDDLRRWEKAVYMNKQQVGVYLKKSDLEDARHTDNPNTDNFLFTLDRAGDEGRVVFFNDPVQAGKGWLEHYYLFPLPSNELNLNKNLKQNDGYPTSN